MRNRERGSGRILIVEDNLQLRSVPVVMLRNYGYEVLEAANGVEAIDQLQKAGPIDLLFTDMMLPGGKNGDAIAEEAIRLQPGIKVLYTSGYSDAMASLGSKECADAGLLPKPYRRDELLEKIQSLLGSDADSAARNIA